MLKILKSILNHLTVKISSKLKSNSWNSLFKLNLKKISSLTFDLFFQNLF